MRDEVCFVLFLEICTILLCKRLVGFFFRLFSIEDPFLITFSPSLDAFPWFDIIVFSSTVFYCQILYALNSCHYWWTNERFHVIFIFPLCFHVSVDSSHRRIWNFPSIFTRRRVPDARQALQVDGKTSCGVQWGLSMSFLPSRMDYTPRFAWLAQRFLFSDFCFLFSQTLRVSFTLLVVCV